MKLNVYVNVSEGPFHCEYFGNPVAVTERYGNAMMAKTSVNARSGRLHEGLKGETAF